MYAVGSVVVVENFGPASVKAVLPSTLRVKLASGLVVVVPVTKVTPKEPVS